MTKRYITLAGLVFLTACAATMTACEKSDDSQAATAKPKPVPAATDPKEVLNQATAAIKNLQSLTYDGEYRTVGPLARRQPQFEGHVSAVRSTTPGQPMFAINGTVRPPAVGPQKPVKFVVASNGTDAVSIDYAKQLYSSGRVGTLGDSFGNPLFPDAFFKDNSFENMLASKSLRLAPAETVNGVLCDVVIAKLPGFGGVGVNTNKMFFGRKDHILRRAETLNRATFSGQTMENTFIFSTKNLKVNPKIEPSIFTPACPMGFMQTALIPPDQSRQPGSSTLPIGEMAPNWTLTDASGNTVSLESLRGKVVVLDFWATWCGPCKMAMPGLQKLHEKYKDQPVAIYGVNCRERSRASRAMDYIKKQGYTYGQLIQGDRVAAAYRVSGLPTLFVIGPDGRILHTVSGYNPALEHQLDEIIQNALPQVSQAKHPSSVNRPIR